MKLKWYEIALFLAGVAFGGCTVAAVGILVLDSMMSEEKRTQQNADEIWEKSRRRQSLRTSGTSLPA